MPQEKYIAMGKVKNCMRELTAYGNARKAEIGAENVFDFSLGSPSAPVPGAVTQAMIDSLSLETLHDRVPEEGLPDFRKAIADDLKGRFGMDVRADCIFVVTGAAGGLAVCINALLQPGEEVILFAPYFTEYRVFVEGAGGVPVTVGPDANFQPDLDALRKAVTEKTKVVLVNTPNNPTGVVLSEHSLKAISSILNEAQARYGHPIYLVSDEPYRELVYDRDSIPCVMNAFENSILCYSFSKSLSLPGERIGYLALNAAMRDRDEVFTAIKGAALALGYTGAPGMMQHALIKCVGLTSDLSLYRRNRDLLYSGLTSLGYSCVKPEGAFYLFMKSPIPDAKAFSEAAKKYELLLVPSDDFGIGGYMRLAYCVPTETIERSIPAFKKLAEEFYK